MNNLNGSDTLYVRSGNYTRNGNLAGTVVPEGSLHINKSGTAQKHTIVSAYASEQPVIYTQEGKMQYNPDPGDTSYTNSSKYYPWPAISVGNAFYVTVSGFKTFGQVAIWDSEHVILQNSDLGGGGPGLYQGNVVYLNVTWDILIQNNRIHHSCWGSSTANGAAVMSYSTSNIVVQNNYFYDNWGADFRPKDLKSQDSRSPNNITVRYNFFAPGLNNNMGIEGTGQAALGGDFNIYQNIFYGKSEGIFPNVSNTGYTNIYNNTFVNCTADIRHSWDQPRLKAYNNLHYHESGDYFTQWTEVSSGNVDQNYNLFYYKMGSSPKWKLGSSTYSTIGAWQGSGKDTKSVEKNPNFINPSGSTPESFKRSSYSGDVQGSQYGTVCGAYITGNEIIGASGVNQSIGQKIPNSATGILISE